MKLVFLADKDVEAVTYDQALDNELDIGQSAFVYGSLYTVNVYFTIHFNVIVSKNGTKVRKYVLEKQASENEFRALYGEIFQSFLTEQSVN